MRSTNAVASQNLDVFRARVEATPSTLAEVARRAASEIEAIIRANIAAQRAPDGSPWPATKDGRPALERAADAVTVRAVGPRIVITVSGVEARHDVGAVRGRVRRQIVPTGDLPGDMSAAIERVVERVLDEHMRGVR